ncbi:MAG TPA: serine/threonine-protein kinase [Candidatus Ozemobacteraceae bacterium]|nr:serine/threonine-protein kinase [Candidatus Ozemobacteraceae bacterium]
MAMIAPPELTRYKLLDLIGCGGMGSVFIGIELKSEKFVAIKLLSPECVEEPVILERFKLEGQILKGLSHPNIVKFIEAGQEGDYHYLVMEYVKGLSMDAFPRSNSATTLGVKQSIPTIEEYLTLFIKCFDALGYVHKQGIVHRDIKPHNIILTGPEYSPRLIDFGIAKKLDESGEFDQPGEKLYTVVYASPEQLMNKPVDQVSDLFSFGVVMYEKLTGRLPFEGKKEMEVFLSQTKWNFPPPRQLVPEIPQKLEQIVLKLLSKDPASRYPTAAMVQGELEKLLEIQRTGRDGLNLSGIISDIRETGSAISATRGFKKRTIADEQMLVKKARSEYVEAKNQLRAATLKLRSDPEHVEQLKAVCEQLRVEYERLQGQLAMALGFKSQPLVIDRFNAILKLETVAFEKRGVPFNINTIEQKLAHSDGSDIIVGSMNFTERVKRVYSFNQKDSYLAWDESTWFFNAYDEKDFPIFVMVGDPGMPRAPQGFRGFFWPFEFLLAIHKLGRTGVSIIETFTGCDRRGQAVSAQHKETILFSNNLFDALKERLTKLVAAKNGN